MRAGMGTIAGRCTIAAGVTALVAGCLSLPSVRPPNPAGSGLGAADSPPAVAESASESPRTPSARASELSGKLDGPTLRLAVSDLAVILETAGRLEGIQPELRTQMFAELAAADATTAAAIVKKWRDAIPELQHQSDKLRLLTAVPAALKPPVAAALRAVPQESPFTKSPRAAETATAAVAPPARTRTGPESPPAVEPSPPEPPNREALLRALYRETLDRAESAGPDSARAGVQLELLRLFGQVEQTEAARGDPDPEMWNRLTPAIEMALGTRANDRDTVAAAREGIDQVASQVREPERLGLRGLTLCRRIRGFGNFDPADATGAAGQPVLVYSELVHFKSERSPGGFRTCVSSRVELRGSDGRVVWGEDFEPVDDVTTAERRDYFLSHGFRLPASLKPGRYSIHLTARDELAQHSASDQIAIEVR